MPFKKVEKVESQDPDRQKELAHREGYAKAKSVVPEPPVLKAGY